MILFTKHPVSMYDATFYSLFCIYFPNDETEILTKRSECSLRCTCFLIYFSNCKKCKHEDSVYGMCNKYSLNSELHFLCFIIKVCNQHEAYMTLIYCSNLFFPVTNVCNKWICHENMVVEACAKVNYICGIWHKA